MDRIHGSTGGCRGITEQFGHSCTDLRGTWNQDSEESGPTVSTDRTQVLKIDTTNVPLNEYGVL
jgi:hypothetical protein